MPVRKDGDAPLGSTPELSEIFLLLIQTSYHFGSWALKRSGLQCSRHLLCFRCGCDFLTSLSVTLQKLASDPRCKGMPLSSFLLKPMQRITRYPLLIRSVSAPRDRRVAPVRSTEAESQPASEWPSLPAQWSDSTV